MPLNKVIAGSNMYQGWVTHTHTHLGGACPHACGYCYVKSMSARFRSTRYTGPVTLIEKEFNVKYGRGKTIFMEHMTDLFAADIPDRAICYVIDHIRLWPDNLYVFQTKNPARYLTTGRILPPNTLLGCTMETDGHWPCMGTKAPPVHQRRDAMAEVSKHHRTFITVEPALQMDPDILAGWIAHCKPEFVNIGIDSKGNNVPDATLGQIWQLSIKLKGYGIKVLRKRNIERLERDKQHDA